LANILTMLKHDSDPSEITNIAYRYKGRLPEDVLLDVRTACSCVEKMFLSVEGSQRLPQWGFELWSVFYLRAVPEQLKSRV
jgi:hypothetical protein